MSNVLNKVLRSLASPNGLAPRGRRSAVKKNRRFGPASNPRRRNAGAGGGWSRALPASYASHVKSSFRAVNRTQNSLTLAGCDLVTPLPAELATQAGDDQFLFSVIPANPAYWTGTRIAQIAPAYMTYRPIRLQFRYIPQVAVTQQGTVVMGTLWNGAAPSADLQQTLLTSNGGCMINCYVPGNTNITLKSNLQQNLFTMSGDLNPDTCPFLFVAVARGCTQTSGGSTVQVVPGYFYVEYVYELKNPIGQSWIYTRTDPMSFSSVSFALPNESLVLLTAAAGYGPGTIMDLEYVDGAIQVLYHGTPVDLTDDNPLVQIFENGQTTTATSLIAAYTATKYINSYRLDLPGSANAETTELKKLNWQYSGSVTAPYIRVIRNAANDTWQYSYIRTAGTSNTATSTAPIAHVDDDDDTSLFLYSNNVAVALINTSNTPTLPLGPTPAPVISTPALLAKVEFLESRLAEMEAQDAEAAVVPLYTKPRTNIRE